METTDTPADIVCVCVNMYVCMCGGIKATLAIACFA